MPDANITKKALAASMKKLMEEKPFDKISVIDICEGCGMNRKSFYYHFKDKYDLVNWIFYTDFIVLASSSSYSDGWDLLQAVVKLFYRDQSFYICALEIDGQNSFREYFYESTEPIFHLFTSAIGDVDGMGPLDDLYVVDIFLVVIYRWLKEGCVMGPEKFTSYLRHVMILVGRKLAEISP